jgi:alpha-tubulin suppressor-like RCC1 family protein
VAVGGAHTFSAITAGTTHTCAVTPDGIGFCWGENSGGRLGDGTQIDRAGPVPVLGGVGYATIRAGDVHTCGRSTGGSAICWGGNITAQLGDGSTTNRFTPVGVKKP